MNITNNTTAPNFTAKLKNNEAMQNVLDRMFKTDLIDLKYALKKLDEVHKGDVLELRDKGTAKDDDKYHMLELVNTKDENKKISFGYEESKYMGGGKVGILSLGEYFVDVINDVAKEGHFRHNALLHDDENSKKDKINVLA